MFFYHRLESGWEAREDIGMGGTMVDIGSEEVRPTMTPHLAWLVLHSVQSQLLHMLLAMSSYRKFQADDNM